MSNVNAVVLGSTGSMGSLYVERFAADPRAHVVALAAAGNNLEVLAYQAVELGAYGIALYDADLREAHAALDDANLRAGANVRPEVLIGPDAVTHAAAAGVNRVVNAIAGIDGVAPSLAALETGAHLEVANTETLLSRDLLTEYLPPGTRLTEAVTVLNPALAGIQDALRDHDPAGHGVSRIVLTASPGPGRPSRRRGTERAVNAHTGFTAGVAMLELRALTDAPIDVVHHDGPIAAIVELSDGRSILTPRPHASLVWDRPRQWSFEPSRAVGIELSRIVGEEGGTYPVVLYTASIAAARAHLEGMIGLEEIGGVVAQVLDEHQRPDLSLETLAEASRWAQERTLRIITARG